MSNFQREERSIARGLLLLTVGAVAACIPGGQPVAAVALKTGATKIAGAIGSGIVKQSFQKDD